MNDTCAVILTRKGVKALDAVYTYYLLLTTCAMMTRKGVKALNAVFTVDCRRYTEYCSLYTV